ncbi:Hsp70 family protein [Pseudooceanicola aestuarii]|uniref:Hsp70 family protein n=1 Tax=Pseudooceanicola aestuarii TaxID=2697319 RepID=UPI0013D640C9|nr:Hsp70 family protein [Pseudooceanicola aestuarii]
MPAPRLAVDFGTSNSAAAVLVDGRPQRLPIEAGAETLPTAVFFPADGGAMQIGQAAARALIAGDEGRYMRALKSVLGTPLFHEKRPLGGRRRTLAEIVTAFLAALRARAEAETGRRYTSVLSGRPVRFHSAAADAARDAVAQADLEGCYHAAGFTDVAFLAEPEAAALASTGTAGETGLIVDIGGGTSDFTLFRRHDTGIDVVGSHGVRLGGTDFDRAVSLAFAMPQLGLGGQLRRVLGEGLLPVPRPIYNDLASWAMIPFLYTRETERMAEDLAAHALEPEKMARLVEVIRDQLGHDLAFAVERGKIAANGAARDAAVDMSMIVRGLSVPLSLGGVNDALAGYRETLRHALLETLFATGTAPDAVNHVVLVGGSSLMRMVEEEARAACPAARISRSEAFTAVVDGLALATVQPAQH